MVKRRNQSRTTSHAAKRPTAMTLLWDGPSASTRGPKAGLTLDTIVQAGLRIVDAEGLGALTMARVAEDLDVTPMATYRHVPSKEELLDLMIDAAFADVPRCSGRDWRAELTKWARAELQLLGKRPWILQTVLQRVAIGPNWLAWVNAAFTALSSTNLRASEMFSAATLVDAHVRAVTQMMRGAPGAWSENFNHILHRASQDARFAVLARVVAESGEDSDKDVESEIQDQFEFGLQRLLDGLEAHIHARESGVTTRSKQSRRTRRISRARK